MYNMKYLFCRGQHAQSKLLSKIHLNTTRLENMQYEKTDRIEEFYEMDT